jgi:hypothetical protein
MNKPSGAITPFTVPPAAAPLSSISMSSLLALPLMKMAAVSLRIVP